MSPEYSSVTNDVIYPAPPKLMLIPPKSVSHVESGSRLYLKVPDFTGIRLSGVPVPDSIQDLGIDQDKSKQKP